MKWLLLEFPTEIPFPAENCRIFFTAEKAAGNPNSTEKYSGGIFRRSFSGGNPFLSDLWRGHVETFTYQT